jgi:arginyl-tRNA synthetase
MFEEFKRQAKWVIIDILEKKGFKKEDIEKKVVIEEPPGEFGDLSAPCFDLAPILKKSPKVIAEELVREIETPKGFIKETKAVEGYINFSLDYEGFSLDLIKKAIELNESYGRGEEKDKIILEHTSANPDGPLHIGHARNAIIGDCLARIMRFAGYNVETQFYVNDMGRQLAIVVLGLRKLKLDKKKKKDHAIAQIYIQANKMLKENPTLEGEVSELMQGYEEGDKGIKKEFETAANYCIEGIKETLGRINVKHDSFIWESSFVRDSSVRKVVEELRKSEYAKEGEVLYLDLTPFGIKKELVITRKDGTYLYTTRDIAYHIWKSAQGLVIDVWGADHKLVAGQLKAALKILGYRAPEFIIYEFISLPEGSISTRKGVFISLDDLVAESITRAYTEVDKRRSEESEEFKQKIAEMVGIGAVRYNIAKISPEKAMVFKWDEALDFERQGSPFIQYAHARACRILEKTQVPKNFKIPALSKYEKHLIKAISKFPEAVKEAAETRKPSLIASYVLELANAFHKFYMFEPVLKSKEKDFRLNLVQATKITLRNALNLLGIEALEAM